MSRFILCLVCATVLLAGCKKDEGGPTGPETPAAGTESDAAELVAVAIAAPSNGAVAHVVEAVTVAQYGALQKRTAEASVAETQFDTTVVRKDSTAFGSYDYTVHLWYQFSDVRNKLDFSYNSQGSVNLVRIASSDTASSVISVQHITDPDTTYLVNVTAARTGSTTLKARNVTLYGEVTVTLSNVLISKRTYNRVGGTGVVAGTLRDSNGRTVVYSGSFSLTNLYQAILLLNGKRFIVSLITGAVTAG